MKNTVYTINGRLESVEINREVKDIAIETVQKWNTRKKTEMNKESANRGTTLGNQKQA